ncbi:MAG: peptidyl-prolyl cis-trans isomerase [Balneolaceae bacterium]
MQLYNINIKLLLVSFALFVCYGCTNKPSSKLDKVAEIGGVTNISFSEVNQYYKNLLYDRRYPESKLDGYKAALNDLIVRRQKEIDFVESGMAKDSLILKSLQRLINEEIIVQYFNEEYLPKYINEETIQRYYVDMAREVTYRQIVLNKPKNASKAEISALRNTANKIKEALRNNEDAGKLALQYSQHKKSAQNGGYMPPITWQESTSNALIQMIFNMNEGVIQALENPNAFYIIVVEKVKIVDVPPLKEVREDIEKNLREIYLDRTLEEYTVIKEDMVDINSFVWNEDALEQLIRWAKQNRFYEIHYENTFQKAIDKGNNFVILSHSKGEVDLANYLQLVNEVLIPGKPNMSKNELKDFIEEAVKTSLVVKMAKEMGKGENLLTFDTPSSAISNQYERLYTQKRINSQIPEPTEASLRSFYEAEKDSLFYQLAKVTVHAKIFNEKEPADNLWSKIQQGQSFEEATNRSYKVKTYIINRDGQIESFLSKEPPYFGEIAFGLDEGEVAGPVEFVDSDNNKQYAIIKSAAKKKERQLEYSEIKNIEKAFREYHKNRLVNSLKNELKKKYPATIHYEVLEQHISTKKL